jgi:two-component system sensor histidine kinase TctE
VPLEVGPVASVNDLLTRLKDSIATQKRFLADAAHQLKTPLAGLRMQADLAQREGASEADLKRSLQQIGRASMRATHTVNQLLALARAEGSSAALPASAATWR